MPGILLETGDVTLRAPALRHFRLEADRPPVEVRLCYDDQTARIEVADWPALLDQVRERSLSRWKHTRMDPPMGDPDMQNLLAGVSNTPAYQLFLAGFDISEAVGLVGDLPERTVLRRAIALSGRLPSLAGQGGVFFLPDVLVGEGTDPAPLDELILNNKLCRLTVGAGDTPGGPVVKYYVPYATPLDFTTPVSRQTRELWDRVRDYFYAFR